MIGLLVIPAMAVAVFDPRQLPKGGAACSTDADCSLTGSCTAAKCRCDAAWTGPACEQLHLLPARRTALYPAGGHATELPSNRSFPWGGSVVKDDATGLYHLFVTEYMNRCPMSYGTWTLQSSIRHATAATASGPWEPKELVLQAAAGNPVVARAPDGTYVMYFTNVQTGPKRPRDCTSANRSEWGPPRYCTRAERCDDLTGLHLAHSKSINGPWTVQLNIVDKSIAGATNPGVIFLADGTTVLTFKGGATWPAETALCPKASCRSIGVVFAPKWNAWPYKKFLSTGASNGGGRYYGGGEVLEDPSNGYADTTRGALHTLFHQGLPASQPGSSKLGATAPTPSGCKHGPINGVPASNTSCGFGGAAHSADNGTTWTYANSYWTGGGWLGGNKSSFVYAYEALLDDDSTIECQRREEPKLLIEGGEPTALISQCSVKALGTMLPTKAHPKGEVEWSTVLIVQPINAQKHARPLKSDDDQRKTIDNCAPGPFQCNYASVCCPDPGHPAKAFAPNHRPDVNWTKTSAPVDVPSLSWQYAGGAAGIGSKLPGQFDIRSGGPGQTSMALAARPLASLGHAITAATVSFRYISGYGCAVGNCANAANVSLALVDSVDHSVIATIWRSPALNNASFSPFSGYSAPVTGGGSGLSVRWSRRAQLALVLHNNARNLQIPTSSVKLSLTWGQGAAGAWEPAPQPTNAVDGVVIAMHGVGDTASSFTQQFDAQSVANDLHAVIYAPQSVPPPAIDGRDDHCWRCFPACKERNLITGGCYRPPDDVTFLTDLSALAKKLSKTDYSMLMGCSNGGSMLYRVACNASVFPPSMEAPLGHFCNDYGGCRSRLCIAPGGTHDCAFGAISLRESLALNGPKAKTDDHVAPPPPPPPMVASPPSTLLPPGATTLAMALATAQATACRWAPTDVPFAKMPHTFAGSGGTAHSTTLTGLSGTLEVAVFHVRCAAFPGALTLVYRSLPDVKVAPFPRLGNLWGNGNFRGHPQGLTYAASRSSLWLGSDWTAAEIAQLRKANPFTVVLTSINACETNRQDLPDDFYLTNVTRPASTKGRLQSWPGAWRLDLTNPAVQEMQAQLMYGLILFGGHEGHPLNGSGPAPMPFDGIFVDNVFMDDGQFCNNQDIFHNKFFPSTITPGKADDLKVFAERWRAGMVAELNAFRALMPHALMDGHIAVSAMRQDTNISAMFNAVSIGFTTPEIIEGRTTFADGMKVYSDWMTLPTREPHITMVESAVRFQLGCESSQ